MWFDESSLIAICSVVIPKFSHRTSTEKCSLGPALGQLPTYFVRATHLISKLVVIHNYIHGDQSFEYLQYELMNININEVLYPKCVSWSSWLEIRRSYQSHNRWALPSQYCRRATHKTLIRQTSSATKSTILWEIDEERPNEAFTNNKHVAPSGLNDSLHNTCWCR
jgi:hypothetical protein